MSIFHRFILRSEYEGITKEYRKEKMINKKKLDVIQIISTVIILISIVPSIWFMIFPRYYYKDNCGNYAGAVILLGAICVSSLVDYYKSCFAKYAYIFRFFFGVYFVWTELMMFYYNAKVYMMAFAIYLFINVISLDKINRHLIQFGVVILIFSSYFVNKFVNNYHEGLYSIGIHYGIIAYFVAILLIFVFTCYINYSEIIQGRSRVLSGIITILLCLVLDDSYVKGPLVLSYIIILLTGNVSIDTEKKDNSIKGRRKIRIEKNRLIRGGASILSVLIPYCILGPLEIYAGNVAELTFPYYHFFVPLVLISVVFAIVFSVLIINVEDRLHGLICAFVVAIGVISWIQAMFLNKNIFNVNGHTIDWAELYPQKVTNLIIWIMGLVALILLYIVVSEKIDNRNIQVWVACLFSAMQLVAVGSLLFTVDPIPDAMWIFDSSDEFKIAREENVIILILDSFGQESLEEAIGEDDAFLDSLHDFTMYTDVNSTYNGTFPSITYMFTGRETPNQKGFDVLEYVNSAYCSEYYVDFTNIVHKLGYKLRYYTNDTKHLFGDYSNVSKRFDNAVSSTTKANYLKLIGRMMQMSLYRYMPYVLKPYLESSASNYFTEGIFYSDNWNESVYLNSKFYDLLEKDGLSFSEEQKGIGIIHLFGLHYPYETDKNCNTKYGATKQENIDGLKLLIDTYIGELKRLDMYDNSTVIITADHGGMLSERDLFPILLIKQKYEKHMNTQTNDYPIDSKDFVPTILEIIGADNYSEFGLSIFDNTGEKRNRVFYYKLNQDDYLKFEYYGNNEELLNKMGK